MPGQVPEQVKSDRSAALFEAERQMSREFRDFYIGKTVTALLEEPCEIDGVTYDTGYTKEYLRVAVKARRTGACAAEEAGLSRSNCLVQGTVTGQLLDDLYLLVEF